MELLKIFYCTRCEHQSRSYWRLIKHYHLLHSIEPGFSVTCGVDNCQKAYSSIKALCTHLRSKHSAFYHQHIMAQKRAQSTDADLLTLGESQTEITIDSEIVVGADVQTKPNSVDLQALANNHIALWSLKLREIHKIPGSVCEEIRHSVADMLCESRTSLLQDVHLKLQQCNASQAITDSVVSILSAPTTYEVACTTLSRESHVSKYIEDNLGYVEPIQYVLANLNDGDSRTECMQYVPLLDSIKALMQNNDIFSAVVNSHESTDNKLRDFCDGTYFKCHPLFSTDNHALQVVLYYDEFCAVNPLGHRAKQYKISAFYYTLANVQPKDRSRLHAIYLLALCFTTAVKRCSFAEVLKPVVNDLTTLSQEGVTIQRPDGSVTLKGALVAVVADNLAAHAVGGFFESFTSSHPCRFCVIRRDKLKTEYVFNPNSLRTPETHDVHLSLIQHDQSFQSIYGIKAKSCLSDIPYYHVVTGLPSDVMHDLLEGVVCDVLDCIIQYCITSGFITMEFLNSQIANFPYVGTNKTNKPDVLTEPTKCRQTAAKCRCLLQLLPLMVGSKIPFYDAKWEVLLLLLDIHDIARLVPIKCNYYLCYFMQC